MKTRARWLDLATPALLLAAWWTPAAGAETGLAGIVSDLTRTPAGRSFFLAFHAAWEEKGLFPSANLTVRELPAARGGTTVTFEHQGKVLFQAAAFGARVEPNAVGSLAADAVARNLAQGQAAPYLELDRTDELR